MRGSGFQILTLPFYSQSGMIFVMPKLKLSQFLFDAACLLSLVGIWPRFIEPNYLKLSRYALKIPRLRKKISLLQISDLHLNPQLSDNFLKKIINKANSLKPDLIIYTGDFLCRSQIGDKERLKDFLSSFSAPNGCFAVLGNHDYAKYICINRAGEYDAEGPHNPLIPKLARMLCKQLKLQGEITEKAFKPGFHTELLELLRSTPFQLLHNESIQLPIGLNICGLGEHMAGHCHPQKAFANYMPHYPGIILVHNPDAIPHFKTYPGDLILCGHTHGAQINLPYLREKLTPMENPRYKRGLLYEEGKWIYTNRGLGGVSPVRLFSPPELAYFTLEPEE